MTYGEGKTTNARRQQRSPAQADMIWQTYVDRLKSEGRCADKEPGVRAYCEVGVGHLGAHADGDRLWSNP